MFLEAGYSVLLPDSRAHGASGGQFVTYGLLEKYDALEWAAWMKRSGCRAVYALGESLGGSVLIESLAVKPVFNAVVAECAYADLRQIAEYRISRISGNTAARMVISSGLFYADWFDGLDLHHVSPREAIARSSTPVLLIHGLMDDRTPFWNSEELKQANPANALWLVPGAGHTGAAAANPAEFRTRVLGWFASHRAS
jgi:hypothetical protein